MCWTALLPLAGTALSAVGSAREGQDARENAEKDARLREVQADDELRRGNLEEERYRRDVSRVIGTQKAEAGARNVRRSGTALDLLSDTAQIGEEDALTIRNDSARSAWGLRVNADDSRRFGRAAAKAGQYRAGAQLLTGAAQAYGQWKAA